MGGIYVHIPFCSKKCGYCDFYSIIRLKDKSNFISALCREIILRKKELKQEKIRTIYFGGGTPSLLRIEDLKIILDTLKSECDLSYVEEFTIEVNPDDISLSYLHGLLNLGFNRLSMGIQSFNNRILAFMNRRHNVDEAINAIKISKESGFKNISLDLIYGIPNMTIEEWKKSIEIAINLNVQHISAYHLTFEPDTVFYKKLKRNELSEINESESVLQFEVLTKELKEVGFIDYEISNFCKPDYHSKHNSNYWTRNSYFGFGPSAHSFSKNIRRWNVSNLNDYITSINNDKRYFETENLSEKDEYNEIIMLGLRTKKGIYLSNLYKFNREIFAWFNNEKNRNIELHNVSEKDGFLKICEEKRFLTDQIISDFFIV